jgi:hypothetical protein
MADQVYELFDEAGGKACNPQLPVQRTTEEIVYFQLMRLRRGPAMLKLPVRQLLSEQQWTHLPAAMRAEMSGEASLTAHLGGLDAPAPASRMAEEPTETMPNEPSFSATHRHLFGWGHRESRTSPAEAKPFVNAETYAFMSAAGHAVSNRDRVAGGLRRLAQDGSLDPGALAPPEVPQGYDLVLYLPYRQVWELKGYTRGKLLNSIPLTPQEETTIEIFSWDRHTRETEDTMGVSQESTETTKSTGHDSLQVSQEVQNQKGWKANGKGDIGVPLSFFKFGIEIGGDLSRQLTDTTKATRDSILEATAEASTTVKSNHQTKVAETSEWGSENRVTRKIRNSNMVRTLTYDYFEVLVSHAVSVGIAKDQVRLAVLVDNALPGSINRYFVLQHEGLLHKALLNEAYLPGFEAARLLASIDEACVLECEDCACHDEPCPNGKEVTPALAAALDRLAVALVILDTTDERALDFTPWDVSTAEQWRAQLRVFLYKKLALERANPAFWRAARDWVWGSRTDMGGQWLLWRLLTMKRERVVTAEMLPHAMLSDYAQVIHDLGVRLGFPRSDEALRSAGFDDAGFEAALAEARNAYNAAPCATTPPAAPTSGPVDQPGTGQPGSQPGGDWGGGGVNLPGLPGVGNLRGCVAIPNPLLPGTSLEVCLDDQGQVSARFSSPLGNIELAGANQGESCLRFPLPIPSPVPFTYTYLDVCVASGGQVTVRVGIAAPGLGELWSTQVYDSTSPPASSGSPAAPAAGAQPQSGAAGSSGIGFSLSDLDPEQLAKRLLNPVVGALEKLYEAWNADDQPPDLSFIEKGGVGAALAAAAIDIARKGPPEKKIHGLSLLDVARAIVAERQLLGHLSLNESYYREHVWRALDPADRYNLLSARGDRLFEFVDNDVLAYDGNRAVMPFRLDSDPNARKWFESNVANSPGFVTEPASRVVSVPTPGMSVQTRLGPCDTGESFVMELRELEVRGRTADVSAAEQRALQEAEELRRRKLRLDLKPDPNLRDPVHHDGAVRVILDDRRPPAPAAAAQPAPPPPPQPGAPPHA